MGLRGNIGTLRQLRNGLEALPAQLAVAVAADVAPALTRAARASYDAGEDVYGNPRPTSVAKGKEGNLLTLVESGATRDGLRFVADGTRVRVPLPTRWAKYLIGKFRILPIGDRSEIPFRWRVLIRESAARQRFGELARAAGLTITR